MPAGGAAYPDAATDGNPNTNYFGHSCALLGGGAKDPFFTLDLGHVTKVGKVRLWYSGDCGYCPYMLDKFQVRFGMDANGMGNPVR